MEEEVARDSVHVVFWTLGIGCGGDVIMVVEEVDGF